MTHTDNINHHQSTPADLLPFMELLAPGARVLDLGCGKGIDLACLVQAGFQGVGVDSSPVMVQEARAIHMRSGVEILEKNFLFLSLEDASYDGVWANLSFPYLAPEELQRLLAICFKGVKVGGILGAVLYEGAGSFEMTDGQTQKIYRYSEKALCSMFEQTGFQVKKIGRKQDVHGQLPKILMIAERI